ncbi:MAG: phosphoribosyl-ATP diphosphatase [Pirellulaceae bacterium]|nr:phosphoribosyl-ATP diphosphatase [Pirellulaceae bacterium]
MSAAETQDILDELMKVLQDRRDNPSAGSYTASLFVGGESKIGAKILEEAAELVESTSDQESYSRQHFIHETADLFFHTLVMLVNQGVSLTEIRTELSKRFGVSGLQEKANRRSSNPNLPESQS